MTVSPLGLPGRPLLADFGHFWGAETPDFGQIWTADSVHFGRLGGAKMVDFGRFGGAQMANCMSRSQLQEVLFRMNHTEGRNISAIPELLQAAAEVGVQDTEV